MSNKKLYLILGMFAIIFTFFGGSLAYFEWQTSTEQQTAIAFTIADDFSCSVDGGGNITSAEKMLAPASCTNEKYAIQRTITANANISQSNLSVLMDLWINVDSINTNLSNSQNFKYALTTNPSSCTEDVIASGTFTGTIATDTLPILTDEIYESSKSNIYYLYVWLDAAETDPSTMDQQFSLSLGGNCEAQENTPTFDDYTQMITSYTCGETTVGDSPYFTYTGECEVIDDGDGDWRIRFLTDGTFTSTLNIPIDAFLVGGGGGGGAYDGDGNAGGGGGGGYTTTTFVNLKSAEPYSIDIGTGGGSNTSGTNTTGFGSIAFGGGAGKKDGAGGHGGSGGGYKWQSGGSNGGDGGGYHGSGAGTGQETTTREFGDDDGQLYSGGGGGGGNRNSGGSGGGGTGYYGSSVSATNGTANTGGGGGGGGSSMSGGTGGSGIVVIRNTQIDSSDVCKLPTVAFDFTYIDGYYAIEHEGSGNWKIKFLTSGTFTSYSSFQVDAFLVGGGGGGGVHDSAGGGGGGGYTTTSSVSVNSNQSYVITIGSGGGSNTNGNDTTGFDLTASGGKKGSGQSGGAGGSGGGMGYNSGGSNGSDGGNTSGGSGQITAPGPNGETGNTREFGLEDGKLYAGGGGGGGEGDSSMYGGSGGGGGGAYGYLRGSDGALNTGGGGGGGGRNSNTAGSGGSGIVIIRNVR